MWKEDGIVGWVEDPRASSPLRRCLASAVHLPTRSPRRLLTVPHRGAHTFFLRQGDVPRWGGYTVNLIHYEDAAALCLAVLQGTGAGTPEGGGGAQHHRSRTFLGCDGAPVTFEVGGVGHACGSAG